MQTKVKQKCYKNRDPEKMQDLVLKGDSKPHEEAGIFDKNKVK